ncbi:MAG: septum site-determining protein MinD [Desulfobacula sp.]|nr:septum site-determining protein MinD [Desulfobacula sp.]MDA8134641.1 septum site-determining protein MinD [Desulfobacteraceae bacterium]OGQ84953.1 MAG: septum site-determining protein MinD [Deltaproteobacteria bacterium RIFOXYC2_FULL_48_10]OGR20221.1 MAG: septum site-determining protein MinD [Desulfobacula sp. RIFOXYA12_FULL_46_16]
MEGKVIVVTSGKGGVGKTTATSSIGAALALEGKRVAIVDMDIGLRNLDVVMGLENRIVFNIVDVVLGKCKISQAAIRDRRIDNLFLIPASQSDNKDVLSPAGVERVANELRKEFDYVIMDSPAGIERGFQNAIVGANEAIVICTPDVSSVRDADRVIGILYSRSLTPKLVVNRIEPARVERGEMLSYEDVLEVLSIELLGLVPMDEHVLISSNTGTPLVLQNESKAGHAFRRIAKRLNGEADLPIEIPTHKSSMWKKISKTFGFK